MSEYKEHPDAQVRSALIRLSDASAEWERNTGNRSIIIYKERGYTYRAQDGKPVDRSMDDIPDEVLTNIIVGS